MSAATMAAPDFAVAECGKCKTKHTEDTFRALPMPRNGSRQVFPHAVFDLRNCCVSYTIAAEPCPVTGGYLPLSGVAS